MARIAVLSYHTSPLAQAGTGDGGGMNVYVREIASAVARQGHEVDVFTRRDSPLVSASRLVEPGFRVHHIDAGPYRALDRDEQTLYVGEFTDGVSAWFDEHGDPDVLHANYWLSALAGHRLKHDRGLPLMVTFHTLERVKANQFVAESEERALGEAAIFSCADAVLASCAVEAQQFVDFYQADSSRITVVPLGVEHAFFSPGDQRAARQALGRSDDDLLLTFVGRLQALKGVDLALETTLELRQRGHRASLAIIGGPSGPEGMKSLVDLHRRVAESGAVSYVNFVAPQSHQLLSTWLRAADVTLVPSRSESFGLVALESSACGTPVVASAVGGLLTLIQPGVNGDLVDDRSPVKWADTVERVVAANDDSSLSNGAVLSAQSYTWRATAQRFSSVVHEVMSHTLVRC